MANWVALVPAWLQGIGSIFALIFTAIAVFYTYRAYKATLKTHEIESGRDRVDAEARAEQMTVARKAQAVLVSAWWGPSENGTPSGAYIRNASGTPVYQAYLTVLGPDESSDATKVNYLVVPPSDKALFCPAKDGTNTKRATAPRVKLTFTDAAGVRWLRDQYGLLTELNPQLRVKTGPTRARVLDNFRDSFHATYGVTVAFDTLPVEQTQERYVASLSGTSVPDALICPHDWIGYLIERGLIEPTTLSEDHRKRFHPWALAALSSGGHLYGLPTTVDTVALIRNTDLAPDQPATFNDLIDTGNELCRTQNLNKAVALRVGERGDPFQVWPLFASAGGWLFRHTCAGGWDSTEIGLDTPESVAAFEQLRTLGQEKLLDASRGRTEAIEMFATGKTPFLLTSSDALPRIRQAGIPVEVTAVPPFRGGQPADGLALVHGLIMTKNGPNKIIAHDLFADYLTHDHVMVTLSTGLDAPSAAARIGTADPALKQFLALSEVAKPIPSFPQMQAVWRVLERAEIAAIRGADAAATANQAASEVARIFEARQSIPRD
jgi:arabinogalactan oligomer / maltooligosaccharide transport system substrate-binding protein